LAVTTPVVAAPAGTLHPMEVEPDAIDRTTTDLRTFDVPCQRWAPGLFWLGVASWVLLSFANTDAFFRPWFHMASSSTNVLRHGIPEALLYTFYPSAFGAAISLTVLGIIVVRMEQSMLSGRPSWREAPTVSTSDPCFFLPLRCPARWPTSALSLAWLLEHPIWVPLARLSYSVYLVQFIPMFGVEILMDMKAEHGLWTTYGWWVLLVTLTLVGSMGLAVIIYVLVEKPCMELREARKRQIS
jgi:peptidoglycan/LPS O-acetylase OafA/YrhL